MLKSIFPKRYIVEVTDTIHRIPREYHGISQLIQQARYGHGNGLGTRIFVKNVTVDITNPNAINAFSDLEKHKDINAGEREAIPLAIELVADFISNDHSALKELNTTYSGFGSVGKTLDSFISDLEINGVFTPQECNILRDKLWE